METRDKNNSQSTSRPLAPQRSSLPSDTREQIWTFLRGNLTSHSTARMPVNNTSDILQDHSQDDFFTPDRGKAERILSDSQNSNKKDYSPIIPEP